tara:strand:- start:5660 stop:6046 length:387 start_codon:yes stop_codon:yes gene_type:complete
MKNTIIWFEINVANLDQAKYFYDYVLQTNIRKEDMEGYPPMGIIPGEGVNGALVEDEEYEAPEHSGIMLYFDGTSGINAYLERIEEAGGEVVVPRSFVNEFVGYWAAFSDLDGNLLAFYEPPEKKVIT